MVKQDRNFVAWILLSLVTCGIYNLFFMYSLIKDVNVVCTGDGQETPGLLKFIGLGIITCGIYAIYWYYKLGERLQACGQRTGAHVSSDGTNLLLWIILGSVVCGIGYYVAMYMIIADMNRLAARYNNR